MGMFEWHIEHRRAGSKRGLAVAGTPHAASVRALIQGFILVPTLQMQRQSPRDTARGDGGIETTTYSRFSVPGRTEEELSPGPSSACNLRCPLGLCRPACSCGPGRDPDPAQFPCTGHNPGPGPCNPSVHKGTSYRLQSLRYLEKASVRNLRLPPPGLPQTSNPLIFSLQFSSVRFRETSAKPAFRPHCAGRYWLRQHSSIPRQLTGRRSPRRT